MHVGKSFQSMYSHLIARGKLQKIVRRQCNVNEPITMLNSNYYLLIYHLISFYGSCKLTTKRAVGREEKVEDR